MSFFHKIPKDELERAATEWALEQVKPYGNAESAAEEFFDFRVAFIKAYQAKEEDSNS